MLKLIKQRSALGRSVLWAALVALILSFAGNLQKNFAGVAPDTRTWQGDAKVVLDTIPAAIRVFRAKPRDIAGSEGWILTVAETLGALVTFAAVLLIFWAVFKEQFEKLRISFLRRHTIILGFGTSAKLFLKSKQRPKDRGVVVVDPKASRKIREKVHAEGCLHYASTEETDLARQLKSCAIKRADRVIVSADTDADSLEILRDFSDICDLAPKDVVLDIRDVSLHQQIESNDGLMQGLGNGTILRLFNYPKAAAVDLTTRVSFTRLAVEQGQDRVYLLVFGATPEATEVVTHYLRASPSLFETKPKITWIVPERDALLRLLSLNYPALAGLLTHEGKGPLSWAVDLQVHVYGEGTAPYDADMLGSLLTGRPPPTAMIVADQEAELGKSNIQLATALRQAAARLEALRAPVFVFSQKKSAEDQFLLCRATETAPVSQKKLPKTDDLAQVIEPFGRADEVCAWGNLDTEREKKAQALHAQYLADRVSEADTEQERSASMRPWDQLPETYKNANRRAVDQEQTLRTAKWQLETAGLQIGPEQIEGLAAIEHNSWWIDRELDGWEYAPDRDNARKFHPNLIPYEELTEQIKTYDRAKVHEVLATVS